MQDRKRTVQLVKKLEFPLRDLILKDRPYRFSREFVAWETIANSLAYDIQRDAFANNYNISGDIWLQQKAPAYAVKANLLREIIGAPIKSDKLFNGLDVDFGSLLFAFPLGMLKTPDNTFIDHVFVSTYCGRIYEGFSGQKYYLRSKMLAPHCVAPLRWGGLDTNGVLWEGTGHLTVDGVLETAHDDFPKRDMDLAIKKTAEDNDFLDEMWSILVHCIISALFLPSLHELDAPNKAKKQKNKKGKCKAAYWSPRYLSSDTSNIKQSRKATSTGTHTSPRPHIRMAHYRNQPCGKGNKERKIIRIGLQRINGA